MRNEPLFEQLMYYIKVHLHNDDIMNLNNRIAEDLQFDWMYVYDNQDEDVINDILDTKNPIEILRMASSGEYNVGHDFVRFNGYGNLISSNCISDLTFDYELMVDWIIKHPEEAKSFGINLEEVPSSKNKMMLFGGR